MLTFFSRSLHASNTVVDVMLPPRMRSQTLKKRMNQNESNFRWCLQGWWQWLL